MSNLYKICGLNIESDIPLTGLPSGEAHSVDLKLKCQSQPAGRVAQWFHQRTMSDGTPWMHVGRLGSEYVLRFTDMAEFVLSPQTSTITFRPHSDLTDDTVQHLFADQVLPLYLVCIGRTVLHASAVGIGKVAVAFMGKSGSGKSTLAASFCREQARLIADDCLILEKRGSGLYSMPSYPGLRLWEDSVGQLFGKARNFQTVAQYGPKLRVEESNGGLSFTADLVPIARIFVLEPRPDTAPRRVSITDVKSADLFIRLLESTFRLDVDDKESLTREFAELTDLVKMPVFRQLSFPQDFAQLRTVREAISRDVTSNA